MTDINRRDVMMGAGALALVSTSRISPAEPNSPAWRKLTTEAYKGKQDDICFVDADHGWYGNGAGKLFRTTNGGESWDKLIEKPGTFIRALGFANRDIGYLGNVGVNYYPGVTDKQPLYRTTDGGKTWTAVQAEGIDAVVGICGIDILPVRRIFQGEMRDGHIVTAAGRVGGPATMLRSDNDGESWRVIDLSKQAGMILDVKFHDAKTGFVAASGVSASGEGDALILMTKDGGATWAPVWRSGRKLENAWKMSWPSRKVGYATVQSYDEAAGTRRVIIKTTNGGRSWRELPLVDRKGVQEFGIGFLDEQRGWVGTRDTGYETRDGGKSWSPIEMGRAVNKIRILKTADGARGFAIGTDVHRIDVTRT
jgi:photosystem II stability/assembly factor-like uncharacterized protein